MTTSWAGVYLGDAVTRAISPKKPTAMATAMDEELAMAVKEKNRE
jgi:hypothetical protein